MDILDLNTDDEVNRKVKNHYLVGKVISNKYIKAGPLRTIPSKAWSMKSSLEIQNLERNILLFVFKDERDKRSVVAQGPWSVMDSHLVLKAWPPEATLEEIDFSKSEICV
ncbi:hypothetical protein REPUB_Repub15cG0098900 [Reevesia pubescens]